MIIVSYLVTSGDWASGVWNAAGIPGQEQSCAQRTGVSTCEAFVRANGGAMAEACTWFLFCTSATERWTHFNISCSLGSEERQDLSVKLVDTTRNS